jgi:maltooligosyltrehalose synthase
MREVTEVPDANEEYLLYQTLVGAWPLTPVDETAWAQCVERLVRYMEKALKEAKVHTSWTNPQEVYDQAVRTFVKRVFTPGPGNRFLADCERFQARMAPAGLRNALAQILLKCTSPGVPDIYQGTELWDDSLVDPDNRRPVDFSARSASLAELQQRERAGCLPLVQELLAQWWDGRLKLYVTSKALHFRRSHATLFQDGDYLPLLCRGARREHVIALWPTLRAHLGPGRGAAAVDQAGLPTPAACGTPGVGAECPGASCRGSAHLVQRADRRGTHRHRHPPDAGAPFAGNLATLSGSLTVRDHGR